MNRLCIVAVLTALTGCAISESIETRSEVSREANSDLLLHVDSPDWRVQVIYMLLIDRFDDGDASNNDQGHGEHDPARATHFSGGDLQGVIDRIDYLQSMGVTALWVSPPVENQWWSSLYQATGWHGYWATNFRKIDPHFGTLDDYKRLSHELHSNGMYLIQDIVANHTANWFTYDGEYDPEDTAKNFRLLEPDSHQPAPTQPPFHMIDRLNPEHFEADIYHWTPSISDYGDLERRTTWQLGALADINTENPVVIRELKDTYKYWMDEVGVDGYRIDTIIYVPFEFWHRWSRDDDGIYAHARAIGKDHFLTFGETFLLSDPFDDAGEREIIDLMVRDGKEGVNSMLGFPLYQEINRVFGQGQPPRQLEYRLDRFMDMYPDPYVIPNFVDNHDTPRFLATGHVAALKQALAMVFTIPGIPIIYQGTEQGLPETRMAMYEGGHRNREGSFDADSDLFVYLQQLSELRRSNPLMTRGTLEVLASETAGPGLLAYRRDYQGDQAVVLFNTADHSILMDRIDVGAEPGTIFDPLFTERFESDIVADDSGRLSLTLPGRSIAVSRPTERRVASVEVESIDLRVDPIGSDSVFVRDFELSGSVNQAGADLQLLINGNADRRRDFMANENGRWTVTVPVRDLGRRASYAQIFARESGELSAPIHYTSNVEDAAIAVQKDDPPDDAHGPTGAYVSPLQQESRRQREIESVRIRSAGGGLELTLTMAEVTDVWLPPNGFDNVVVTTFIDLPGMEGARELPLLDANMPDDLTWDLAHFATGWISYAYRATGASADREGEKLGTSPEAIGDSKTRTIRMFYDGDRFGVDDWSGARFYVTTWDTTGEGVYVDFQPEPSEWFFSGGSPGDPKVMDDVLVVLESN